MNKGIGHDHWIANLHGQMLVSTWLDGIKDSGEEFGGEMTYGIL
jgi:hypothetical protein